MKKIILILGLFLQSLIILSLFLVHPTLRLHEMIVEVDSRSDAILLAEEHDILLKDYSTYGYAIFDVPSHLIGKLELIGFNENSVLKPMGRFDTITSDPYSNDQYALSLMHVTEAWTLTEGSSDVVIAIVDTGIDTDHEDFVGRILQSSYNSRTKTTSDNNLSHIEDDNGHGTMVAGIIAANKNNQIGIAGIVSNSKLLVIKANNLDDPLTEEDESEQFLESSIAEAIHYARIQGADIINLSLGTQSINSVTESAIEQAVAAGIVIVGASGNDGDSSKFYPASYPGVISVGSVDETLTISDFSNFNNAVDIAAPGAQIVSTAINNAYASGSGTSFAAPQITGVVALMLAYFPMMTSENITTQLLTTAVDRGTIGYDNYYGYGVVHAADALLVDYVTITFETNGGTLIEPLEVVQGYAFDVADPIKEGHTFLGWYTDDLFTTPFEVGVEIANASMTLYAKYEPLVLNVLFYINQTEWQNIDVIYGENVALPIPEEIQGYDFVGWYYDALYTTPYANELIYENTVLYARYDLAIYTISYYVGDELLISENYPYQTVPNTPTPDSELVFIGWYYDESFIQPYIEEPVTSSFTLYARFNDGQYTVTFYDYDLITVLSTDKIVYGQQAVAPKTPLKPQSPSFTYDFIGWSESFDYVINDLVVYPLYEKTYIPSSISLLPGIDTVSSFDLWIDASVNVVDELLHIETSILEMDEKTYQIIYRVMEENNELDILYRMVSITIQKTVIIELLPDVSTVEVGQTYQDGGAQSSIGDVMVINEVDTSKAGIYRVIYQVTYQDYIYQKTRYVYVLESSSYHPILAIYYRREEEVLL